MASFIPNNNNLTKQKNKKTQNENYTEPNQSKTTKQKESKKTTPNTKIRKLFFFWVVFLFAVVVLLKTLCYLKRVLG